MSLVEFKVEESSLDDEDKFNLEYCEQYSVPIPQNLHFRLHETGADIMGNLLASVNKANKKNKSHSNTSTSDDRDDSSKNEVIPKGNDDNNEETKFTPPSNNDQTPYKCEECGMTYLFETSYKAHLAAHTRGLRVHCQICRQALKSRIELRKHMLKKHKQQATVKIQLASKVGRGTHFRVLRSNYMRNKN